MDTIENYLANNYVDSNNKDINNCIASAIKNEKNCKLEPVDTYLDVNEKMFKQISVYKKSHEKLKEVMNKLYTCPLVTNVENETFKDAFGKLTGAGNETQFINLLNKYIEFIRKQFEEYKNRYIKLKKQTYKGPYMNGGIWKSPDDKYLLGLLIIPLKEEHKNKYMALTKNESIRKQSGIAYSSARKGDLIYGIGFKGQDFTIEDGIAVSNKFEEKFVKKFFPLEEQETQPVQQNTTAKARSQPKDEDMAAFLVANKDSFTSIPKKSNGLMYVILFILLLVLFRKLKK